MILLSSSDSDRWRGVREGAPTDFSVRWQQEQMIIHYVQAHGQITRNETAELCGLSPDQANRLLRRLVSAGKLGQRGENKGRVYILPANPNR